jgi:hypothetical protein
MAFLLGNEKRWNVEQDIHFVPKGGLNDLLEGIRDKSIDTFLWETFTVKPYNNQVKYTSLVFAFFVVCFFSFLTQNQRQIGTIATPWPCFVICAREETLVKDGDLIRRMLSAIQEACREFTVHPETLETISKKCHLDIDDSKKWLDSVKFSNGDVSKNVLKNTGETLVKTGVLKAQPDIEKLYYHQITSIIP